MLDIELDSAEPLKVPNLQDFRHLLRYSKLFQEFFNVFLNLPVFSQKFYYDGSRDVFNAAYSHSGVGQISYPKTLVWIHKYRLPLFWKSELLFEYLFTTSLSLKSEGSLASIHDYKEFRSYILLTQGESLIHFWLDSERAKYLKDPRAQDYLISKIHHIYTNTASPCLLPPSVADIIMTGLSHCRLRNTRNAAKKFSFDGGFLRSAALKVFTQAQEGAMDILCHYWLAKYCVHFKKSSDDRIVYSSKHRTSSVFTQKFAKKDASLESIDHEYCNFPHVHNKGKSKKLPVLPFRASQKESFHGYNMFASAKELSRCNHRLTKLLKPLIAPGVQNLMEDSRKVKHAKISNAVKVAGGARQYSLVSSGLKADKFSGNPFMRYLLSKPDKSTVVNYLLFWQSLEEILREDKVMRSPVLLAKNACYPYHCYHYQPVVTDIEEFLFLFVKPDAFKGVFLPTNLQKKMLHFLPKGLGKSLLTSAQMFAFKKLLPSWREFLAVDCNLFISQCIMTSGGRVHRPTKNNIVDHLLDDTQVCHAMWTSMQLAESILTPECTENYSNLIDESVSTESTVSLGSDMTITELFSAQLANPMITRYSTYTYCTKTERKTLVTSVTLPAIEKPKKVGPPIPKTFSEILQDSVQLENFEKFLLAQDDNYSAPLEFWMTIEEFKNTMDDIRLRDMEAVTIHKNYFGPDADKNLQCQDPVIYELMQEEEVSPYQLISAQLQVIKSMEENWFQKYVRSLRRGGFFKLESNKQPTSSGFKQKNHVKTLWRTFLRSVCQFMKDVSDPDTLVLFRKYLAKEILNSENQKKVFGKRVVYLNKILDDLGFWIEAQRFKYVADSATETKRAGAYTQEIESILHRKAHAIINCYLNSPVPPKVQINCPPDVVHFIMDRISQGLYKRELFHEAMIFVFPSLLHYWRMFSKNSSGATSPLNKQAFAPPEIPTSLLLTRKTSYSDNTDSSGDDDDLVLSFSLSAGIFWRRGRQILRYECLKDYLTFRVSYLY